MTIFLKKILDKIESKYESLIWLSCTYFLNKNQEFCIVYSFLHPILWDKSLKNFASK